MKKDGVALIIVFFVFISSAYAQDYALFSGEFSDLKEGQEKIEFKFYNKTYSICESERKTIPILIVNRDTKTDNKYSLESIGASWINLNIKEFSLPKQQSGVVFLDLSPGQNTNGKYNIKIIGESAIGNVKRDLNLDINVEKCYSLSLDLEKEEDKICGGIKRKYRGEITNDGIQKIDIVLNVNGPNWVSIDKNAFSVAPNDKQKFELSADIPANAKGIFSVVINAVAKNLTSIKSEKSLKLEVIPKYDCYKADIITNAKITNYYSNEYIQIKIINNGLKQAIYDTSLEAPNWISIEPKKITVNPDQFGNLNLNINPDAIIPEGNYPIKIYAKFEDNVYSKNIDVILSKNQFLKGLKSFFVFYQYYIYIVLVVAVILLIFRQQISNKIKTTYKNHKIRQARLRALEAARKARQLKKKIKDLEKAEFEVEKINKFRKKWIFVVLIILASVLFFSIYQFNFLISKEFVKSYYAYFIAGILISLFIIFVIEFYRPLFRLLKNIDKPKKKK